MRSSLKTSVLLVLLLSPASVGGDSLKTYLVELNSEPLAELARPAAARSTVARSRLTAVRGEQAAVGKALSAAGARLLTSVENVLNGLIIAIEPERAEALRAIPGVRRVYADCDIQFASDKAMEMNGIADAWQWMGGRDTAGEGIKVAILDSGIVPSHPAFQDRNMKPPPGYPRAYPPQNLAFTNGKIIVIRNFSALINFREPTAADDISDTNGHGTAVASVIAGVPHQTPFGFFSGVAPKAWIGVYVVSGGTTLVKALDMALEDGMDIANLSALFTNGPVEDVRSAMRQAVERARRAGLLVVIGSGPIGPTRSTIADPSVSPDAITVGGTPNSRMYAGSVSFGASGARQAFPGSNRWFTGSLEKPEALRAQAADITAIDPSGGACLPLPAGSLTGRIAVASFTGCTPEVKLKNLEAAGAAGAIFYTANAATAPSRFQAGTAALGGVVVGFNDGGDLRQAIARGPTEVTMQFDGVSYALETNLVASYSSRGPTYDHLIKPEITATGDPRYVAAQKTNPSGVIYSPSGYGTRYGNPTPSFATATVSGALAVLMSKRPGLSLEQYRSLIINSATPIILADGSVARVMDTGAGALSLAAALRNTLAVYPQTLSFGIASLNISQHRALTLTNLGNNSETYVLRAIPFDSAPPLKLLSAPSICQITDQACINRGADVYTVTIEPGKTASVYPRWFAANLPPGEYQGQISIEGSSGNGITTVVPYWLGVPSGVPAAARAYTGAFLADPSPYAEYWNEPAASATFPGAEGYFFYLVTDSIGLAITDPAQLQFKGTVINGGGRFGNPEPVPGSWGAIRIPVTLGPAPGPNTFQFQFGQTAPITASATSVARP